MSVHFLSTRALTSLRGAIVANQSAYVAGHAGTLIPTLGSGAINESRVVAGEPPTLLIADGNPKNDGENVRRVHRWLGNLTPVQASDSRLWTYLTHVTYADYTATRWPIDATSQVVARVRDRYFIEGEGLASITRNSIARLWWFGHLTYDVNRPDHYELTDVLLSLQDIQQAFLERAIGRSRRILQTSLSVWQKHLAEHETPASQGTIIQGWAKLIRLHGAVVILDALADEELQSVITRKLAETIIESY